MDAGWIANDVSITVSEVNPDQPFEEFGLSSRSILELAGQLEDLTGKSINAAVVYQNPTVNKLAVFLLERLRPAAETHQKVRDRSTVEGADIAIIGVATRFPGDADARAVLDTSSRRRRCRHRPSRRPLPGIPGGQGR
ncbi:MAG: phosphopantetheine-binding protein [Lawsonella clevelandensis]